LASKSKSKKQKYISYILRFSIIGVLILLIGRGQQWGKLAKILLDLNLWIFGLAIACYIFGQIMVALRWYLLFRTQHGMMLMAAFSYWLVPLDSQVGRLKLRPNINLVQSFGQSPWIALSIAAGAVVLAALFLLTGRGRDLLRMAYKFITEKGSRALVKSRSAFQLYCHSPVTIIWAFFITIVCQILQIVAFWLVGQNIGIPAPIKYYFVFFPISWVMGALPISPGGAAVVEGGLVFLFTRIPGVMPEQALALALYQRLVWLVCSVPGAGIHIAGAHLPKDFFIDYKKPIN